MLKTAIVKHTPTRKGDDGTTGLFLRWASQKDCLPTAYGEVDEAQAAIILARAHISKR